MSAGPGSATAAPPPRSGPGAPQPRRFLGMSPTTVTIVAVVALVIGGVWLYRRRSASSSSATAPDTSSTGSDVAAETGTLQTEIADLQGQSAQDASADDSGGLVIPAHDKGVLTASSQQQAQIEALQDQIANMQKDDQQDKQGSKRARDPDPRRRTVPPANPPSRHPGPPVRTGPAPARVHRHHHTRSR